MGEMDLGSSKQPCSYGVPPDEGIFMVAPSCSLQRVQTRSRGTTEWLDMVAPSYSIQGVHTVSLWTTEWLKQTSGTQNSLQAVRFTLICKIGNELLGPILA